MSASALQPSVSSSQMTQFHRNPKSWCCVAGQLHARGRSRGVNLRQRAVNVTLPKGLEQEQKGALAVPSTSQPSLLPCERIRYIFHIEQEIKQRIMQDICSRCGKENQISWLSGFCKHEKRIFPSVHFNTIYTLKGVFLPWEFQWLAPCLLGLLTHQCWLGAGRFSAARPLTAAIWQLHRAFGGETKPNSSKLNLITEICIVVKKHWITTPWCCSRELAVVSSQQGHRSCCALSDRYFTVSRGLALQAGGISSI